MRYLLILSIGLLAIPCAVHAQTSQPPGYRPPPPAYHGGSSQGVPRASTGAPVSGAQAANPENCGTPDEPKPCPRMPRHPLPDYPPNR